MIILFVTYILCYDLQNNQYHLLMTMFGDYLLAIFDFRINNYCHWMMFGDNLFVFVTYNLFIIFKKYKNHWVKKKIIIGWR